MTRYKPTTQSPNKDYPDSVSHGNHRPCEHCDEAGYAHDRVKVYPDGGPPGSWKWEFRCP